MLSQSQTKTTPQQFLKEFLENLAFVFGIRRYLLPQQDDPDTSTAPFSELRETTVFVDTDTVPVFDQFVFTRSCSEEEMAANTPNWVRVDHRRNWMARRHAKYQHF